MLRKWRIHHLQPCMGPFGHATVHAMMGPFGYHLSPIYLILLRAQLSINPSASRAVIGLEGICRSTFTDTSSATNTHDLQRSATIKALQSVPRHIESQHQLHCMTSHNTKLHCMTIQPHGYHPLTTCACDHAQRHVACRLRPVVCGQLLWASCPCCELQDAHDMTSRMHVHACALHAHANGKDSRREKVASWKRFQANVSLAGQFAKALSPHTKSCLLCQCDAGVYCSSQASATVVSTATSKMWATTTVPK